MITSTDNTDVIITRADAKPRGTAPGKCSPPVAGGPIDLDDEAPAETVSMPEGPEKEQEPEQKHKEQQKDKESEGLTFV